jgi:hypothetical protein
LDFADAPGVGVGHAAEDRVGEQLRRVDVVGGQVEGDIDAVGAGITLE